MTICQDLPSGATLEATTDTKGPASFFIPHTQKSKGVAEVRARSARNTHVEYDIDNVPLSRIEVLSGLSSIRDRVSTCIDHAAMLSPVLLPLEFYDGVVRLDDSDALSNDTRLCVASALEPARFRKTRARQMIPTPFGNL